MLAAMAAPFAVLDHAPRARARPPRRHARGARQSRRYGCDRHQRRRFGRRSRPCPPGARAMGRPDRLLAGGDAAGQTAARRRRGRQLVIGLPGNPVSSYVTAFMFLLPLLRALGGARAPLPRGVTMKLGSALPAVGDRTEFVRARTRWRCTGSGGRAGQQRTGRLGPGRCADRTAGKRTRSRGWGVGQGLLARKWRHRLTCRISLPTCSAFVPNWNIAESA